MLTDEFCVELCGVAPKRDFYFSVEVMDSSASGNTHTMSSLNLCNSHYYYCDGLCIVFLSGGSSGQCHSALVFSKTSYSLAAIVDCVIL